MLLFVILGALVAAPAITAFPAFKFSVAQKLDSVPQGWLEKSSNNVDKEGSMIKLRIQLTQPRISEFYDVATKIATPGHVLYGQHLSKIDADAFLAPDADSVRLVREWLKSEKLQHRAEVGKTGDNMIVHASVADVERLLKTQYSPFVEKESGKTILRTMQYSIPDILKGHIDIIEPTTFFGMKSMKLTEMQAPPRASGTDARWTCGISNPTCLSSLYNYGSAKAYTNGRMGTAGFLGQFASRADLSIFMKQYATQNNRNETFTCVSINGGGCPTDHMGEEASIDTQYARVITQKIPNVYYSTGGSPPVNETGPDPGNEPYLELLNYLLALPDESLPNTISISYGDDQPTVPADYAIKCCDMFAKLGARGVSILVASGDSGVGSQCPDKRFETTFPASCPWVTTVGGTDGTEPENAWTLSGGGFSTLFAQPGYQAGTISAWLENDKTHQSQNPYFNASGRAYPDVAALATHFPIFVNGASRRVHGTSVAAPVFAAIIQLVNSDRLSSGKKPLGFLNPWLYSSAASALTDIKDGASSGCGNLNGQGFQAVSGWDPVTGLGTPNFEKLLQVSRDT